MVESGYSPGTLSLDVTVLFLRASGVALSNTVGEVSWDDVSVRVMSLRGFVFCLLVVRMMLYPDANVQMTRQLMYLCK